MYPYLPISSLNVTGRLGEPRQGRYQGVGKKIKNNGGKQSKPGRKPHKIILHFFQKMLYPAGAVYNPYPADESVFIPPVLTPLKRLAYLQGTTEHNRHINDGKRLFRFFGYQGEFPP